MIAFADGSIGTLTYLTNGDSRTPKEYIEVFGGGITGIIDNFRRGYILKNGHRHRLKGRDDKGQASELEAFLRMVVKGGPPPISYDQIVAVTQATIAVYESLMTGIEIHLDQFPLSDDAAENS